MTAEVITQSPAPWRRQVRVQRLAGLGGLIFVATVIIQNILRASGPSFTAGPETITSYFVEHRVAGLVPFGLFPIGMIGLLSFTAGIWVRTHDLPSRWWATLGAFAVITIAGLFAIVNATEIVIAAPISQLADSPQVVRAIWAFHSAAFGLNLAAIAIALIGLSRAARSMGLISRLVAIGAAGGAACLFIAAIFTVAIVDGGKWLYLGYVGFAIWAIFLVFVGTKLAMQRPAGRLFGSTD